jgi:hypothetical protein
MPNRYGARCATLRAHPETACSNSPHWLGHLFEEILPALTAGATLVRRRAHSGSFPPFVRMLAERNHRLDLPTAYWHELAFLHGRAALPASVRLVVIGGERVD